LPRLNWDHDPPTYGLSQAGMTGTRHQAWPLYILFSKVLLSISPWWINSQINTQSNPHSAFSTLQHFWKAGKNKVWISIMEAFSRRKEAAQISKGICKVHVCSICQSSVFFQ
jgi:hypothetical protein